MQHHTISSAAAAEPSACALDQSALKRICAGASRPWQAKPKDRPIGLVLYEEGGVDPDCHP